MKRDMELVRKVLEHVEAESGSGYGYVYMDINTPGPPGYRRDEVLGHVVLCQQAGYLEPRTGYLVALKWAGRDALDEMRRTEASYKLPAEGEPSRIASLHLPPAGIAR